MYDDLFFNDQQVNEMGPDALVVSLPFSCVLGLLSSIIASTAGKTMFCNICFLKLLEITYRHN